MGKGKPLFADKPIKPDVVWFIEWKSPTTAEWKLLCSDCGETFRRVIEGKSRGHMWHMLTAKAPLCTCCWQKRQDLEQVRENPPFVNREYANPEAKAAWARNKKSGLYAITGDDHKAGEAEIIRDKFMSQVWKLPDYLYFDGKLRDMLRKRLDAVWWLRDFPKDKRIRQILKDAFAIGPKIRS
jgi:hypothetical protein